jgi:hypothetical protein
MGMRPAPTARRFAAAALAAATVITASAATAHAGRDDDDHHDHDEGIEFLGQAIVPTGTTFDGTVVGGLSSITYDEATGTYLAISDDQTNARFYELQLAVGDGVLSDGDVTFVDVTTLLAPDGLPYPAASLDPEGLTLTADGELIVTSEGFAARSIAPWVRRYSADGAYLADLTVPTAFLPTPTAGVRQNLGFEAAAVTPNGRDVYVGTEAALVQDGPAASLTSASPPRILRYDERTGRLERQFVYVTDMVAETPVPPTAFSVNGLVELLPLGGQHLLAMERSFSVGAPGTGNTIKLYEVEIAGATNVNGATSLADLRRVKPVRKELVLDLRELGIPLDNVEGMVLGPDLPDGRRSLILVSDNNFAATQFTQFLLFAID